MTRVSVFGGAQCIPGQPAYEEALLLGQFLGSSGYTVLTGAYSGTMEAVSRGASETGGHVIGVTCQEIENYRSLPPNRWVMEEIRRDRLIDRIFTLIQDTDAAIALPGGVGTLVEITMLWNYLLIGALEPKPLIVVGEGWKKTIRNLCVTFSDFIPSKEISWITFAKDAQAAIELLDPLITNSS